ncbi:hypothetical protein IX84_29130 [Phaeodactylibacter xiamenensis]|uniref:Uncharacterized protein n=2 Tax=Haliscomenobacteraceae TaxID=1937961 RepID=A0A098RZ50_9BACT|nr:hypothetical protein IX84_29130 [Phaeodactylibacter xiamenensis]
MEIVRTKPLYMQTQISESAIQLLLERHSFIVTSQQDGGLVITRSKFRNRNLQLYLYTAVIGAIISTIALFYIRSRIVGIPVLLSVTALIAYMNMREREKEAQKKSATLSSKEIAIKEGFKVRRVNVEDIAELNTKVLPYDQLFVGTIAILTHDGRCYEFLEFFGDEEDSLREDLVKFSNYLIDRFMS